eukprot:Gb_30492 [translate_table: standard]
MPPEQFPRKAGTVQSGTIIRPDVLARSARFTGRFVNRPGFLFSGASKSRASVLNHRENEAGDYAQNKRGGAHAVAARVWGRCCKRPSKAFATRLDGHMRFFGSANLKVALFPAILDLEVSICWRFIISFGNPSLEGECDSEFGKQNFCACAPVFDKYRAALNLQCLSLTGKIGLPRICLSNIQPAARILTWEEGYYESAKLPDISNLSTLTAPDSLLKCWDTGGNPFDQGACGQDGSFTKDQIGLCMAKMSHQVIFCCHSLIFTVLKRIVETVTRSGENHLTCFIGRVACTGNHQWVFREESCNIIGNSIGSLNGRSILEYPAGWHNQFAAGIKLADALIVVYDVHRQMYILLIVCLLMQTIAVVAVMPYGVVQLGSKQTIMENLEVVHQIRTLFGRLQDVPGSFLSDSVQESSSGKIHVPVSSMPLFSNGNQPTKGARSATLLHGLSNQPVVKNPSSSILAQAGGSLLISEMAKGLQPQAHSLPSMRSSSGSAKPLCHSSQLQQKRMQLRSPAPPMSSAQETKVGETQTSSSAGRIFPFQGIMQASNNHQPLLLGSGTRSNSLALMEQRLVKEMGLERKLQLFPANGQSTGQNKLHSTISSAFQETPVLNSGFGRVESNDTIKVLQNNFNSSSRDVGILRAALFEAGSSHVGALNQTEMRPSVPTFEDLVVQSRDCQVLSRPLACTNRVEGTNTNHVPVAEVDVNHAAYKVPTFSTVNIQASGSDTREPSHVRWGTPGGQFDADLLETLSSDLLPSLGDDHTMSVALETTAKDTSAMYQDSMVDNLYTLKESSKVPETSFGDFLAITDDCGPHGFDYFDKYLKSLTKGQDNSGTAISPLSVPDELFDAMGPVFKNGQEGVVWDEMLLPRGDGNNANFTTPSACLSEVDAVQSFDTSIDGGLEGGFFSESKSEHLLDAVVANRRPTVNQCVDDNMSSKTTYSRFSSTPPLYGPSVRADSCSTGQLSGCEQKQSDFVGLSHCRENPDRRNLQNSAFASDFQGEIAIKRSPNDSPLNAHLSSWVEDDQSAKCENPPLAQVKKTDEPVKANRKRARPGESARPRPKDRQQIQDRVRELRDIVPNGTKCSIDALLERTIKHMLFLQSVTKHAEKIKQSGESKLKMALNFNTLYYCLLLFLPGVHVDDESIENSPCLLLEMLDKDSSLLARDNLEGGASWALELGGGQAMGCPIIVENMSQPRQMLVEMLCEERGLFLEIADIIRGLGLTILKGVMESRNDKIWARFVVEANRDVHRVEILLSLMQLLHQNTKNSLSPTSQASLVTHQGTDNGSQAFSVFQQSPMPPLSMDERLQ